jgi:predicted ATP-grasp superfamily ATP-dependent carboligase
MPIPKTFRINGIRDLAPVVREVTYPCIIKPAWRDDTWQRRYSDRKVIIRHGAQELESNIRRIYPQFKRLVVQEIVAGDESNIVCSFTYLNEHSEPLAMFTSKKVRQFPPHFGNSSLVQSTHEPTIAALTTKICKQLGLIGYVSIEFKKDARDGEFKLIEITPCRFNRQTGLSDAMGLSFPYVWYSQVLKRPVEFVCANSPCTWMSEVNEVRGFWHYWRRGEYTATAWRRSYKNVASYEVFAKDDALPFIMLPSSALAYWIRRTFRRQTLNRGRTLHTIATHEERAASE